MTTTATAPLFICIGITVVAIDRTTGKEMWRRELESSSSWTKGTACTMHVAPEAIYAGAHGELFCLSPSTGEILWRNALEGLGASLIMFGDNERRTASATASSEAGAMAAVSAATLGA